MKKINLIEMLQGCSKRNGTTFRQSNPDGQTTVKRQSRLMSQSGCSAVDVPMTSYGAPDEHPMSIRSVSDGTRWNSRGWKYVAMIFAVLVMSMANVGTAWGKYLYLSTANYTSWENDEAIFKLYPGTGSDIAGTKIYDHMYRFDVTAVSTSSNAMYFKRYKKDGSTKWNEFSVTYNATYNTYKVTGWDAGSCANSNITEIYLDVHTNWYEDGPIFKLTTGGTTYTTTGFVGTNLVIFSVPSPSGTLQFERWSSDNKTKWNELSTTYNSSYNAYEVKSWSSLEASYNIKIVEKGNYIYFDNSQTNWSTSKKYFVIGHNKPLAYSGTYEFTSTPISNTKLWYYNNTGTTWRDVTYFASIGNGSNFGSGNWGSSNLSAATKYTGAYEEMTDLEWGKLYLFKPASGSNGASLSLQTANAASGLNTTQTIQYALSIDDGSTYTPMTSGSTPGQIKITAYKFADGTYNSVSNSSNSQQINKATTGTYSVSVPAAYTGSTTYASSNPATGYTFVGWYDGSTQKSTSTSWTDYPTVERTIYARYKATQVTVTLKANGGSDGTGSVKATYGVATLPSITNPTRSGYKFAGWFTGSGGTGKLVIDVSGQLQPGISSYTDSDGKWIATSNTTLYAAWLTVHEPGVYTSTYGQPLTIVDCSAYEVYRYAVSSSTTIYVNAGGETAPITTSDPRNLFSFAQTSTEGACDITWSGWMGHTKTYGKGTETATANGEFKAHSVCQPACRDQQGFIICVKGYSQFSIYAKDANTSGGKNFKVFINGEAQAVTPNDSWSVRRYDLTPANTYVIRVTGQTNNNNQIQGFSLKLPDYPAPTVFSAGSITSDGVTFTITDPESTNNYDIYYSKSSSDPTGGTSATTTSTSTTKAITGLESGTTYYAWVRSVCSGSRKSSWVALTGSTFTTEAAAVCSATQPGAIGKGAASGGTGTITLTAAGSPATNNTWYWQSTADGTSTSESGATKNVSAAGTYHIRSYCSNGAGCWSDARSVTVNASDLLTPITPSLSYASTVNVGGTINPSLSGNTGSGSVTYSLNSVTPAGSLTINSSTGVVTGVTAGGTATVTATIAANGNYAGNTATSGTITVNAPTYTVTYEYNGATSGATPASAIGSSVSLPNPTKTGYTLQGWYTSSGALAGAATATYNPTSNITLYALWREDACAGGGGGSTTLIDWTPSGLTKDTKSGTATPSGGTVAYSFDDPTSTTTTGSDSKSYYKFGSSGNYTITLTPPSSFQADDVVHVKATSKDNSATVGIRLKNNDEETATQTITETVTTAGTPIELTATLTASDLDNGALKIYRYGSDNRFGQVWVTRAGGSGTCYYVTYNGNGADGGFTKDEASHPSGSNVTVKTNGFTKTGYTFTGWNTDPDGEDGTAYTAGGTISSIAGNMILYAQWIESGSTYDITYYCNDATSGCPDNATGQVALPDPLATPTKTNYSFGGWYTNEALSSEADAGATLDDDADLYAKWTQTITLKTGAQGSGADKTPTVVWQATSLTGFSAHTADGYTLQGYYTAGSGGVKVLNADGSFAAANVTDYITSSKWSRTGAAPTLFAQWVAAEDCHTLKYAWKVTGKFCDDQSTSVSDTVRFPANASNLYFTESGTGNTVSAGSSYNIGKTKDNYFLLTAKSGYQIKSICFYGKVQDSSVDYTTDGSSWSSLFSTNTSGDDYYSFSSINASAFGIKLTAESPKGVWIRNMVIEVCAEGGATYSVTYNDNGKTGGSVPSDANTYSYGTPVTVKGNTGSLAKTNYTFAGWTTNDDGTGSSYVEDNTFSITANTTLYAKWTQAVTLNKNGGSTDGSATAVWNATGLTGITHAKPAAGYKLLGYYSASSDGTKVLNSDGTFAATNVTDYITSGKWSRTSATTLYAEYESAGALTWNLVVNSDTTALSTFSKTSAFTEISNANMSNATVNGLTYKGDAKASLTGKISTPANDAGKYVYVTFQVAAGYKFIPSLISVPIQPVGDGEHKAVELSLTDTESHSLVSGSATKCDGTEKGKKTTVTLAGDGSKFFEGTVTLKIYVYPHASATATKYNCYRLGTPITIEGEIEEACGTMPSYTRMSYTTTTFAPNADASGSPITIVGGENIDTYQWKYNKVNDRTSGTNCGTGTSLRPLTDADAATDVTRYYWCEMTNTSCGITIKSPAVAITVAAAKSDASVTWTDPESTPNYGGGGYTIKATVTETEWDGNAADLVITAPAGINIYNVTPGTDGSSRKYVEVHFDVQTSFDRTTYASNIPFTVSAAATASYNAISDDYNVSYSACTGAGEGSSYNIRMRKTVTKDGNYYHCANTDGWISPNISSSYSTGKAGTKMETDFDTVASSNTQYVWVRTYHANVNKVRIYADFRANDMTVSNVYKHTAYFSADSKYAVDYTAVYNGDEENENTGTAAQGYVDITLDEVMAANDILLVKFNDSKVRPLGAIITEGSAGSLNTHLQWSGELKNGATVAKNTTDAYFTYSASKVTENTNTLGTITYSSSNTSVATVDATGKVALIAAGETTIKATLAASGCYKKAEISYTLNVTEVACAITAGTLTLTSGTESKCSSDKVTLTLTGFESDATLQWKDGDTNISDGGNYKIVSDGTTSTLTTDQEGTYSVMVTSGCSVRSNRITITNKSTEVGAKRIVKNWYIKNGRPTPDIELWTLQNGAHLSSVAWDPANTTGLTASDFYESDGKVYLKGKEPSSNTSGADINYTLTLTVEDDCGSTTEMSASGQLIYLHHQKNTDKHVLAFVVTGTEKGGFTEGITAAQTTSVELYNTIAANFDVLATNVYSTDDEQALKEYYSQFDILCVTDYPNTGTKGVNKKSYVDALGALVDIRPILTMEAFVAKLANWKAKGISGTPQSPTTRQYTMLLQCKDHEIFSGTTLTKVGEGDEAMYRVSMVCDTLEDYKTLDATYGAGTHEKDKNYQYGKKPALQGFTFTKEMLDDDLLPLGLIDDGSGNDLQVGIERQAEMEARLMVLGINGYAMERLTPDGQKVVVNALKYLMKKNSEDIADCSNTFVGGDDEEDESTRDNWDVASHWSGNAVPDRTQKVRIVARCVIPANVKPHVTGVIIAPSGKYNHGANTANGSLTIAAGGALIVDGKVEAATAPYFTKTRATSAGDLAVLANSDGNGTLIFENGEGETKATVGYYSKANTNENDEWNWQYMAVPFNDNSSAYRNFYDSYLYRWAEDCSGWEVVPNQGVVYPWVGYTITQVGEKMYYMDGTLVETGEQTFTVPAGKNLVVGNSWTAPIQVKQFEDADFAGMSKNVYLFNTGYDYDKTGTFDKDGGRYEGGTYVTIPIHSSPYTGDSLISSLQAFIVYAKADEGGGTFTLNYDRHIRPTRSTDKVNAGPMHAPSRFIASDEPTVLKIWASGSRYDDRLVVLERGDFSTELDEGWDGNKRVAGNSSPLIFAVTDNGREAVSAIPTMEGTLIGFWAGEDNEYTLHFEYNEEDELYLLDLDNNTYTPVNSNSTYVFTVPDKKAHNRFILTYNAPDPVATGVEETQASEKPEAKAIKFLKDEKVFIFVNGKLYDATGKVVK